MKWEYLKRAHRTACDRCSLIGERTIGRKQLLEVIGDIEAFVKSDRDAGGVAIQDDLLNEMQATRHAFLPETE